MLSTQEEKIVELDVVPESKTREIKNILSRRFGLVADDYVLEKTVDTKIPGLEILKFGKSGKLEHTGEDATVRTAIPLDESKTLGEQSVSNTDEIILKWARKATIRCPVCGLGRTTFAKESGFHAYSELLVCLNCKRADWLLVGEHNEPISQSSEEILWQTNDILITQNDSDVKIYELYGEPYVSSFTGTRIRSHRVYELVNPKLETLSHGKFVERLREVLLCRKERDELETILALRILGKEPRDSGSAISQFLARLGDYDALPMPGTCPEDFLHRLSTDLECLDALQGSIGPSETFRLGKIVLALRNPNGGWTKEISLHHDKEGELEESPGWRFNVVSSFKSNVAPTYLALKALRCLHIELKDSRSTIDFLNKCQNRDGGFNCGDSSVTRKSSISDTFEAVEALNILGAKPKDLKKCVKWLQAHQRPDGGFADDPGEMDWSALIVGGKKKTIKSETSLRQTYHAAKTLSTLDSAPKNVKSCIEYVMNQRTWFGFGNGWPSDTFHALSTLQLLGALDEIMSVF